MSMAGQRIADTAAGDPGRRAGDIVARLERLPISRELSWTRITVGIATFFDGYTALAIAYAMPVLVPLWHLAPGEIGLVISSSFVGQLIGALFFGWLAERIGRLRALTLTVALFTAMSVACLFAWNAQSMMVARFIQGIGLGGEVPVASAYINEFIGAKRRGPFFLLYEVVFVVGLAFAGIMGYFLVPVWGWRAMFYIGVVPAALTVPLRFLMPESPRWLLSRGRLDEAEAVVGRLERNLAARGVILAAPQPIPVPMGPPRAHWRDLFRGIYRRRTLMLWALWFSTYLVNNGLITWLPTLYTHLFKLPLRTSLAYGFSTNLVGVVASLACAIYIDRVGRRRWYMAAFLAALFPLAALAVLGVGSAVELLALATAGYAILQTVTFSLYLYSAELYPTRMRALGTGFGSAWLRIGSAIGPLVVGWVTARYDINYVFAAFAGVVALGGLVCHRYAIETRQQVLEELSP